jgi:glutathione S-transferase
MTGNFDDNKPGPVKVYDFLPGPFPARFRIALQEKALIDKVEFVQINIYKGEQRTEEFLSKINFLGKIPVLEFADGTKLSEVLALTDYVDQLDGNPTLTGYTPLERAHIHMMARKVEWEWLFPIDQYFHHATPGLGPNLEKAPIKEWGLSMLEKAKRGMYQFDLILRKQPYLAGDRFTVADITAIGAVIFGFNIGIPEDHVGLLEWWERVQERSSVKDYLLLRAASIERSKEASPKF